MKADSGTVSHKEEKSQPLTHLYQKIICNGVCFTTPPQTLDSPLSVPAVPVWSAVFQRIRGPIWSIISHFSFGLSVKHKVNVKHLLPDFGAFLKLILKEL